MRSCCFRRAGAIACVAVGVWCLGGCVQRVRTLAHADRTFPNADQSGNGSSDGGILLYRRANGEIITEPPHDRSGLVEIGRVQVKTESTWNNDPCNVYDVTIRLRFPENITSEVRYFAIPLIVEELVVDPYDIYWSSWRKLRWR